MRAVHAAYVLYVLRLASSRASSRFPASSKQHARSSTCVWPRATHTHSERGRAPAARLQPPHRAHTHGGTGRAPPEASGARGGVVREGTVVMLDVVQLLLDFGKALHEDIELLLAHLDVHRAPAATRCHADAASRCRVTAAVTAEREA